MKVRSILVSQPAPISIEKSPFNELIEKHKVKIDFMPFIKVEAETAKGFRSQRIDVLAYSAVIFTSRGNIDVFFKVCEENRIVIPDDMKYFCSTEAIALYLQKYIVYRKRKIFFGKGSFTDLMDIVVKHKEEKFLLGVSEPHKPEMLKALDRSKIKYTKLILSHTVNVDLKDKIDFSKYDIAVFYSISEISSLHENFPEQIGECVKIATYGTNTASLASQFGMKVSVLASPKTFPSMISALDNYITQTAKNIEIDTTYIAEAIQEEIAHNEAIISKAKGAKSKAKCKKATTVKKCTTTATKTAKKCSSARVSSTEASKRKVTTTTEL
ncbi:MAG: uroporphyrinogen-III synthase [Rikenellaceae bacterium]